MLLLLIFTPGLLFSKNITVRSSHSEGISSMILREEGNILATASRDGSVKIWDTSEGHLLSTIQAGHLGIPHLAIHPTLPRIAVVTTDGINSFRLDLWDWENRTRLFSRRIEEVPLFLNYSPRGSFLVYGKTDWDSLRFIDGEQGFEQNLIKAPFGIVSSAFISPSEKTLLSYSPSGNLRYHDLENGEAKTSPIKTNGNLADIAFSSDGLVLFGKEQETIHAINLINGSVLASLTVEGLISFDLANDSRNLAVLYDDRTGRRADIYTFTRGTGIRKDHFVKRDLPLRLSSYTPQKISFEETEIYSGDNEGNILIHRILSGETLVFAQPRIADIHDIDVSDEGLLMATTSGKFILLTSRLFSAPDASSTSPYTFSLRDFGTPFSGRGGAVSLEDGAFLLFSTDSSDEALVRLDPRLGTFTRVGEVSGAVIEAKHYGPEQNVLLLSSSGEINLFTSLGRKIASQTSFGIRSGTVRSDGAIIGGRNNSGILSSSLVKIDDTTGETVALESTERLIFRTTYNTLSKTLYTLGYQNHRGKLRTILKGRSGSNMDREEILLTFPGEDPDASFITSGNDTTLFTSLGYGGVSMLTWNGFTSLQRVEHIPRQLELHNGLLYSLNRDSSVSLWSTDSGDAICTVYIFDDDNWAVVFTSGESYSSPGASELLYRH